MRCTRRLLAVMFGVVGALNVVETAWAGVKVLNLANEVIYYSQGYKDEGLWKCGGWYSIASGKSVDLAAGRFYRFFGGNSRVIYFDSRGSTGDLWSHPTNTFSTAESSTDPNEVYENGVRTSVAALKNAGYKYARFRRYSDGLTLKFGTYWKLATIDKSFSYGSSGVKEPQKFTHLNNRIITFKVNLSSTRGVKKWPTWSLASDQRSVSMCCVWLEGGPPYDPWRPSYKGTVTLSYIYR